VALAALVGAARPVTGRHLRSGRSRRRPGTQGPGTQGPGTQGPGTQGPGTRVPGTRGAGTPVRYAVR